MSFKIPLSSEIQNRLREEQNRTGIAASTLLRLTTEKIPDKLYIRLPGKWITGKVTTIDPEHFNFIISLYTSVPSIKIAQQKQLLLKEKIIAEIARTGVRPNRLLGVSLTDNPTGLRADIVRRWLKNVGPPISEAGIEYLLTRYSSFPTLKTDRELISPLFRQKIIDEKKRTGASTKKIFVYRADIPKGLTSNMVNNWLSGTAKSARKDFMQWVLYTYSILPDKN